jgi:hypothetical protein
MSLVTIEAGGFAVMRIVRGQQESTPFQTSFARAGHAHAGVLVILGLVVQVYADASTLEGFFGEMARYGVPAAAILMPAGFFFSAAGRGRSQPNALIVLVYLGALLLALGVSSLGVGLLAA